VTRSASCGATALTRTSSRSGPGEHELLDVEVAGGEPRLAVREVEVPHAAEGAVEAERPDLGRVRVEALAPRAQRARVARPEREALAELQVGVLGDVLTDGPDRRQRAAWEDPLGDPRVLVAGRDHAVVLHHDRLDPHAPAGRGEAVQGREVRRPVALADRL